jgi:hypothetical protein
LVLERDQIERLDRLAQSERTNRSVVARRLLEQALPLPNDGEAAE